MMPNNYQHSEGLVRSSETRKFGITQVEGQLSTEKKKLTFRGLALRQSFALSVSPLSDEKLMLEKRTSLPFYGGNFTLSNLNYQDMIPNRSNRR